MAKLEFLNQSLEFSKDFFFFLGGGLSGIRHPKICQKFSLG